MTLQLLTCVLCFLAASAICHWLRKPHIPAPPDLFVLLGFSLMLSFSSFSHLKPNPIQIVNDFSLSYTKEQSSLKVHAHGGGGEVGVVKLSLYWPQRSLFWAGGGSVFCFWLSQGTAWEGNPDFVRTCKSLTAVFWIPACTAWRAWAPYSYFLNLLLGASHSYQSSWVSSTSPTFGGAQGCSAWQAAPVARILTNTPILILDFSDNFIKSCLSVGLDYSHLQHLFEAAMHILITHQDSEDF